MQAVKPADDMNITRWFLSVLQMPRLRCDVWPVALMLVLLSLARVAMAADWQPSAAEFIPVAAPAGPRVAYAIHQADDAIQVVIQVAEGPTSWRDPIVQLGIAAQRQQVVNQDHPTLTAGALHYHFSLSADALGERPVRWEQLRMAFAIRWPGGFDGTDRRRERFLCLDNAATHAPLPADPHDWSPVSLAEHSQRVAERQSRLFIALEQPMDGKLSVVIDNSGGQRVRNLVSALPVSSGMQEVDWDGLDDQQHVVPPGKYRWRAIAHPGITPEYQFSYYNHGNPPWRTPSPTSNWGADHSDPVAAATFGDRVYIGSPVAESGHNIIQLDLEGNKSGHGDMSAFVGRGRLILLADEKHYYALTEGVPAYVGYRSTGKSSTGEETWVCVRPTSVLRWDLSGKLVNYDGTRGEKALAENAIEGSGVRKAPPAENLSGGALLKGKLYVSMAKENAIRVLNPADGSNQGTIRLDQPGLLATNGELLVAYSGQNLVRIDTADGSVHPLFHPALSAPFQPESMAMGPGGEIYIADNGADQNIKVFAPDGKLLRQIGSPGGRPLVGAWDGTGMLRPHGITLDRKGQLWVAERDSWPRRISVWDAGSGDLVRDFFGPGAYGAPGGSFDPANPRHWLGASTLWQIDDANRARPHAVLYRQTKPNQPLPAMVEQSFFFVTHEGRRYLIGQDNSFQSIYRLDGDRRAYLCAIIGELGGVAQNPRWTLPIVFSDVPAYRERLAPYLKQVGGEFPDQIVLPSGEPLRNLPSFAWVDQNEDETMQADEIQVGAANQIIRMGYWGSTNQSLTLRFAATTGELSQLLTLAPTRYLPQGTPVYDLAAAWAAALPLQPQVKGVGIALQDRFQRLLLNTAPMRAFDASGEQRWTYPNQWVGVHGSHDAPLPERGVLQGINAYLGSASFDETGDVTVMNGNHGRFFIMTTDGIYLDEMFHDVRVGHSEDAYTIGGEPFGGHFGRADDGTYYLQSGHTDFRVFKLRGLSEASRLEGTLEVSAAQVIATESRLQRQAAETAASTLRDLDVTDVAPGNDLRNDPETWPGEWQASWGDRPAQYPFARAKLVRQADTLHLAFEVRDPSAWVNNGKDPMLLFKTGDAVDFQFSTDPAANPRRSGASPGDRRLLVAPQGKETVAILYDYRVPGMDGKPVVFASPWRQELVDRVTVLKSAKINVKRRAPGYQVTIAVPLRDLGLPPAPQAASLQGDVGVIYGDEAGSVNVLRWYWANKNTGLLNDVPGETMLTPRLWGTLQLTGDTQ